MNAQGHVRRQGSAVAKSSGLVLGCAQRLNQKHHIIQEYKISSDDVEAEIIRLSTAISQAVYKLQQEVKTLADMDASGELKHILEAYDMMLQDPELIQQTELFIQRECINAEWALKKSLGQIIQVFEHIEDAYLRSRKADIEHIGERIFVQLAGINQQQQYEHAIMVAQDFSPMDIVDMWRAGVSGFVSIQGGENSHTMIVARGIGLPGIAGVQEDFFAWVDDGMSLILNAEEGSWVLSPNKQDLMQFEQAEQVLQLKHKRLQSYVDKPSVSHDGYSMPLMANVEFIEEIIMAQQQGVDGIGLFRTEFLFMQSETLPSEAVQLVYYQQVIQGMKGKPVTFRLLDVAIDKIKVMDGMNPVFEGENPALGLRGVRMLLQNKTILQSQLRAIIRAGWHAEISILVPMVTVASEMVDVRQVVHEVCQDIGFTGKVCLGCMIEVPAAALVADTLAQVSDFFSIGSNDLVQYSLAVDRTDEHVSYLYDAGHPAVMQLLQMTVDAAQKHHIPVSVCGELAANQAWLHTFLIMGITSLSMSARHVLQIREQLHHLRAFS
ncbi:phosphoenolpyruvate--protein phosphotransferase [Ghiorsea bivora]|uniref:phosphoenolpyruvate--protein phosphotransferase n=1 Tax=Ghiorsea bivora TaxID=1485545 RepID=UPI00056EA247|nr:phosphoenolpyruvate--protein phosphotransferase [Ghiorsea bivora]